ncbi:MAG: hypothetical protein A3A86_06160 [Elusimicrobia bacterium RIFCSPLOWO2_01_FULL_60_11]|nr:MAG: hypothetical protein A3A86_06160 [Elusimicrobia bacterium RIFCSPLOWO2_01_FULL_60_11]
MKDFILVTVAACFLGAAWFFFLKGGDSGSQTQPVAYNHKKHIDLGLECGFCHTGIAEGKPRAGLPPLEICASCHSGEDENPRTQVVREYVSKGEPIPWRRIYTVPKHVYFSHLRHAGLAKLDCALCHGDMPRTEKPVTKPAVAISMDRCIDCHKQRGVTQDCLACHR